MKELRGNCEIQNGVQNFCICLRNFFNCVHFIIYLILDFLLLLYMTLCLWLQILTELESNITADDYIAPTHWTNIPTGCIVDVMAYVRKLTLPP